VTVNGGPRGYIRLGWGRRRFILAVAPVRVVIELESGGSSGGVSGTGMIPVITVCAGLGGPSGGKEVLLCNNVRLAQGELPVEDVKELPLYTTDIALSE
jgi:hypothetical protein